MDAAQNDQAHNAPSAPQSLAARLYGSNPWCCLDSPVSIPSLGPTDYQGSWHQITQAHPRQLSYAAIAFRNLRQPLWREFFCPERRFCKVHSAPDKRVDAALQIRTLPDTTLLMLLPSRTCLSQTYFFSFNSATWQGNFSFSTRGGLYQGGRWVPGSSYVLCRGRGRFCIWSFQPFQRADGQDN